MNSPFPGMDPYIEACGLWGDFHHDLISEIKYALAQAAPERYLVRAGERSYVVLVEQEGKTSRPFLPDISVTTERRKKPPRKKGGAAVAEPVLKAEPVLMRAFVEEEHCEAFVEIYEATPEQRLVTSIEGPFTFQQTSAHAWLGPLPSQTAKPAAGGCKPGGDRPATQRPAHAHARSVAQQSVYVFGRPGKEIRPVFRSGRSPSMTPSPSIPVPLAKPDPDIPLNLQPMIDAIYQRLRYERSIDYSKPLTPPIDAAEIARLKQQLQATRGQR